METVTNYGIITLLPALVVVVFAIWTRKTWEMLLLGGLISCMIAYGFGFVTPFVDLICGAISDGDTMWIVLISLLFGSIIRLLRESKSTAAFAIIAERFATTAKKSMIITWIMGLVIFIDDYLSVMTTGNAMIDTTDNRKVPREMLAYILDSTSAPVCVIIPISAWVVYFAGVFGRQPEAEYLGDGMAAYYASMPWVFYAWICVFLVPLVILGVIPRLGAMKKAWERTESTGQTYSDAKIGRASCRERV
jgi:tetracycline resistance efflux pump